MIKSKHYGKSIKVNHLWSSKAVPHLKCHPCPWAQLQSPNLWIRIFTWPRSMVDGQGMPFISSSEWWYYRPGQLFRYSYWKCQWIGLRENLNRKSWFLPSNWLGFPVNFPIIQFYENGDWWLILLLKMGIFNICWAWP